MQKVYNLFEVPANDRIVINNRWSGENQFLPKNFLWKIFCWKIITKIVNNLNNGAD